VKIWHGIHPGDEELILNRIKESRRTYNRKEQRAELLIRNAQFIKEWRELEGQPELEPTIINWGGFCGRWGLSQIWDGWPGSLAKFVQTTPGLVYHPIWAGQSIDWYELAPFPDDKKPDYLLIKIDPWTSLDDIKSIWHRVKELKKAVFSYADKNKSNFGCALCWYDLNKKYRMSLGKIARLWIQEEASYIKDLESYKITVREGIKRIDQYIKRLTPGSYLINIPQ